MTSPSGESALEIADRVVASGWGALLPAHRADGADQPVGPPQCVSLTPLKPGLALAIVADSRGLLYPTPVSLLATGVRRAVPGDGAAEAVLELLSRGDCTVGDLEVTAWHHDSATGERGVGVDQTNDSVIVGDRAVVKWTFVADGPHPAPSLLAELTRAGFAGMPRPWGTVHWHRGDGGPPCLVAQVTEYIDGTVDGWAWLVEDLRHAAAHDDVTATASVGVAVGALVASFHRALADTARSATPDEIAGWRTAALLDLDRAVEVSMGTALDVLRRYAEAVRVVFDDLPATATRVMRVHGDLHVGQVLRTGGDAAEAYLLTDFDGSPVVDAYDRTSEQPAALDVAGMAQSFTHAGLVVRRHHPSLDPRTVDRVAEAARQAFLTAYRHGLGDHDELFDERLLETFALRQVCREFVYAGTHLPRWSYVPEAALPMLLERSIP